MQSGRQKCFLYYRAEQKNENVCKYLHDAAAICKKRGKNTQQETQAITCFILLIFTLIEFSINKFFMKRKCIIEETASTQFDKSRYIQNQYHTDERDWS